MFVDSHCHLNSKQFQDDIDAVLARADHVGVKKMLTICTEMAEAQDVLDLANRYDQLHCTVGVHPHEAQKDFGPDLYERLKRFASHDKVIGLGETGLDYYYQHSPQDVQKESFDVHIQLAKETKLPLIVHTRDAEPDTIDQLKSQAGHIDGIIHCFSGTQWLADQALDIGFYISISGIVTFNKADELRQIVTSIPLDRLLIETDAPYLAPVPKRGKTNEPSFVVHTAQVVADLKGVPVEELAKITTDNFNRLFQR